MKNLRVDIPAYEDMNEAQKKIYDQVVAFFGAPIGPRIALLPADKLVTKWGELLTALMESKLPRNFWELAILMVARHWNCQFEFWAHQSKALREGVTQEVIDAIKHREHPEFANDDELTIYQYCHELLYDKKISDKTYNATRDIIGQKQVVELTALMGHYGSVAMTLLAHEVALPEGEIPPLR